MTIPALTALGFLPFVLPLCFIVALSDLRGMRIPNWTVGALIAVFVLIGPFLMPLETYLWQLLHLPVGIGLGFLFYAAGAVGAGDAKFAGAAAPLIFLPDLPALCIILAANVLAGFTTHRIAKHTPLRQLAPHWESWDAGQKFPMGFCLGGALAIYLGLGAMLGG
jgi:prepilin peptidase CpaA